MPGSDIMKKMTVWLHLPSLLIEFWSTQRLLGIMEEAGDSISIDDFIDQLKKMGFARIRVEIDLTLPLKPVIKGKNMVFW